MKNQWQDDLRNKMELHEEPTPEGLWDDIEQRLLAANSTPTVPPKRTIPLWIVRTGAAAVIALLLLFVGLLFLKDDEEELQLAEQSRVAEQNQRKQSVTDTPPIVTESSPAVTEAATNTEQITNTEPAIKRTPAIKNETPSKIEEPLLASATEKSKTIAEEASIIAEKASPITEKPKPPIAEKASPVDEAKVPVTETPLAETETNGTPGSHRTTRGRNHRSSKWQTGLYASNMSSGATSTHSGYGSFVPYELNTEELLLASVEQSEPLNDTRGLNEYQHVYTDIRHSQPITLGISVKYNLNDRWSLTSGLTYTLLSSELRSGSKTDNHYHHSRQKLHYVGIPLNVNYTVWRNPKISTYMSAGGLVEKNVSGTLTTDFVIGDQLETQTRQDIRVKPLQWSVNSAIGIQYQAARHIGLYAEPGITYHFKNSSEVETIYKDNPLNFNLRIGLRFLINE